MTKIQWIAIAALCVLWGCSINTVSTTATTDQSNVTGAQTTQVATQNPLTEQQTSQLIYLIQEEKLAYDIYNTLYEQRWNRKFGNILNAEDNHQNRVAAILKAYHIDYQLSDQRGVYDNSELNKLYTDLVAQWSHGLDQAMQVGIAIEQKDIADIQEMLPNFTWYDDITTMLNALIAGSQNHLAAFTR
jgi:hypothetical protein